MAKVDNLEINYQKVAGKRLTYKLEHEQNKQLQNSMNYSIVKDTLAKMGVKLEVADDVLSIEFEPADFVRTQTRFAGKREKVIRFATNNVGVKGEIVSYSDILIMAKTMSDKAIIAELNIPRATYYRHKKALFTSEAYWNLDNKRLEDEEYLQTMLYGIPF